MKKNSWKTLITLIVSVVTVMIFGGMTVLAAELTETVSGELGSNLTWTLDVDGNLTISGTGDMPNGETPWKTYENNIKTVTIEQGVTSISDSAFSSMGSLKKATLADSVTRIGNAGFAGCTNLSEINLPDSITAIGSYTFTVTSLKNVRLPSGLNTVSMQLFSGCRSLESVYIPDSVNVIEGSVFAGSSVKNVRLPANLNYIPEGMFASSDIETIELPSSLKEIRQGAFSSTHLTKIVIPEGVEIIYNRAFEDCERLKSVSFPSTLRSIGENAFFRTYSLETITIPGNVDEIKSHAFGSSGIKSLVFKESSENRVLDVYDYAFTECTKLKSIELSSNIKSIGLDSFNGCKAIETIIMDFGPDSIRFVFSDFIFRINQGPLTCYVPAAYLAEYQSRYANLPVTFKGDHEDVGIGEVLSGYSLSLEGDIGVNFYLRFYDVDALSDNAKMVFTISNIDGSNVKTQEVYVKPQTGSAKPSASLKDGYYVFKCVVNAKEMTSKITAQVVDGEAQGNSYTYTVQDYAKYMLIHPDKYAKEQKLIKAMLVYGAASQIYFNYNTSNYANSILSGDDKYIDLMNPDDVHAGAELEDLTIAGTDVKIKKARLVLGTTMSEKLYFTGVNDNTVFKYGNKVLKPVKDGEYYVVTIDGIQAQYIQMKFNIKVYDGSTYLGLVNYSPLYYCRLVLEHEYDDTVTYSLKYLISTIVNYSKAAAEYYPINYEDLNY